MPSGQYLSRSPSPSDTSRPLDGAHAACPARSSPDRRARSGSGRTTCRSVRVAAASRATRSTADGRSCARNSGAHGWQRPDTERARSFRLVLVERRVPPARRHARGMSCLLGTRRVARRGSGRTTCRSVRVETASRATRTTVDGESCDLSDRDRPRTAGSCDRNVRDRPHPTGSDRGPARARCQPNRGAQPCGAASASARSRSRRSSMSTSCRWSSARRSACSYGSARCSFARSAAFCASRSFSTRATTMLRA